MKDQQLLDLISSTFSSTLNSPHLPENLQSLKKHLYNRSFAEAFPTSSASIEDTAPNDQTLLLEAYVVRWVPTRVLCYSRLFERITKFLPESEVRVICIGAGCGSESLALQATSTRQCRFQLRFKLIVVNLDVLDSCPGWEPLLSKVTEAANSSLTPATVTFHHADAVTEYLKFKELFSTTNLVTLMFILNELITSQGKIATMKFLIDLIKTLPSGCLILVGSGRTMLTYIDCRFPYVFGC